MKKVLGLDLGVTSIGWGIVNEAENENEKSSIIKAGVRIIHYGDNLVKVDGTGKTSASMTPVEDFCGGKGLSSNALRTKQRSIRRNLQRYKLRRKNLIEVLKDYFIISNDFIFSEEGNATTFKTYKNRALAVNHEIPLEEFIRVLFMINKKRGYKSNRKIKGGDDGSLIDGIAIALQLYDNNQTPGQFVYDILKSGQKNVPDFYRSDLQIEFDKIWNFQKQFYPLLNDESYTKLRGQKKKITIDYFKSLEIEMPETKGNWDEKRLRLYENRNKAIQEQLLISEVAECLIEINGYINNSSGYLGGISDRSKELVLKKITVGQYLYNQLEKNPHTSLKKQVFYRQDYLDEFNTIWDTQAIYHKELSSELKAEIRDVVIFYQRKLKSQKGLIGFCEFESKQIEVIVDGKKKIKTTGMRVIPKSSPLFQEFKIWQILNNIEISNTQEERWLTSDEKQILFDELNIRQKISKKDALKILFDNPAEYDLNYKDIEGNKTNALLYEAYQKIIVLSGHEEKDFSTMKSNEVKSYVKEMFIMLGINTEFLDFNSSVEGSAMEKQAHFELWHLLYSYEGDNSNIGNDNLLALLKKRYGFESEYAKILSQVDFSRDYGSLSAKAIRKILPHLKDGFSYGGRKKHPKEPSACEYAGYKHSKSSLTKAELDNKVYKDKLDLLPKDSLRNPIAEKILNQTVNVVNEIIKQYGKPDEIKLELARELKNSSEERKKMSDAISKTTEENERHRKILNDEFGLNPVSRNDLTRYKLYLELKNNGYRTLYSNTYIAPNELFSKTFDIEHIIAQATLFDDSFSNKTLELKTVNIEKSDRTAYDFIRDEYGETELVEYKQRVENLYISKQISKTKRDKLLMTRSRIPNDFIERDLRDTQYIAKKAKDMMQEICKKVTTTTGSVTKRLRDDWQLTDVMQELNLDKYKALNLTEEFTNKNGNLITKIKGWTKRNDHRHHAIDAIIVAFTKLSHIQYLNNLNARSDKKGIIYGIEKKELYRDKNKKFRFKPPIPISDFRAQVKKQLENVLISFKSNNKVVTKNKNKIKTKEGVFIQETLTPRGQLHQETIYGKIQEYKTSEVKIGGTLDIETINKIAKKNIREALLKRLIDFDNDPKKAFTGKNSIENNPIYIDQHQSYKIPNKVKIVWQETVYSIRKGITPDLFKDSKKNDNFENKVKDIYDKSIQNALINHYNKIKQEVELFNSKVKGKEIRKKVLDVAFSNLSENPIWLNKEKNISIKRVTIKGVSNPVSLRDKKDKEGEFVLDGDENRIPVDFVSTGNNHHVAIYKDKYGLLHEKLVTFYEAVERSNKGLPVIDKEYNKEWEFLFTMKKNECFVFLNEKTGFNPNKIDLKNPNNYHLISPNLFRVQKISSKSYFFRHHLETDVKERKELKDITYKPQLGLNAIAGIVKVRINHLGQIVEVGEYGANNAQKKVGRKPIRHTKQRTVVKSVVNSF